MFKSYMTSAFRDIITNKIYSGINILGLAIALSACLFIALFVDDELGYDQFIPNAERTYRIEVIAKSPNRADEAYPYFMGAYAPLIKERSADVEDTTRYQTNRLAVKVGDKLFYEDITFADPNFPNFMGFNTPNDILYDQQSIILTETIANKYFANDDPIGKVMTINGAVDYRIAYVIPDIPHKSHLAIDIIAPYHPQFHNNINTEFMSMNNPTYVRMKEGRPVEPIKGLIGQLIDENVPSTRGLNASDFREPIIVPVQDVYLKSDAGVIGKPGGDINVVIGFISIAVLILIIATVNYINLATAKALKRAREVGIRKVMGASKGQLITQFLGESVLITIIALLIALTIVEVALPIFNSLLNKEITFTVLENPLNIIALLLISIMIGIIAGIYPAFYLSAFNPTTVLKSDKGKTGSTFLRQFLVFIQFSIAISLIAGTSVIVRQTMFATNIDPGYEKEGVLIIRNLRSNNLLDQVPLFDQQLLNVNGITDVAASQFVPTDPYDFTTGMNFVGEPDNGFSMSILSHQADFFDLYRLRLKAGRKLDENRPIDRLTEFPELGEIKQVSAVLNETAVRLLGFQNTDDILGKEISWSGNDENGTVIFNIVGVIEDFHLRSIHNTVRPMLYLNAPAFYRTLSIRYATDDFPTLINDLQQSWTELAPNTPLGYEILSDQVNSFYSSEKRQMSIFITFAILAIIISAIGILGLTAFSTERRTKEIGIRKVLGAKTLDIVRLMVGQFSKPVLLANIIALPVAWLLMERWLSSFVYRVDLNPLWFISAGVIALLIAWITVSIYSLNTARTNPVDALRYE